MEDGVGLPSGPGNRICVVASNNVDDTTFCYAMDLSPFKAEKEEKKNCSSWYYNVELCDKFTKKKEGLVVGESLLERNHHHHNKSGDENGSVPVFKTDCIFSSFAAVDESTFYCVSFCIYRPEHSHGLETTVHRIRLVEGGGGDYLIAKEKCASPRHHRISPQVLGLAGKLYVFGGLPHYLFNIHMEKEEEEEEYPWSEVFDPVTGQWDVFAMSPPAPFLIKEMDYKFYAATYNSRVVIISPIEGSVFAHKPGGGWELLACSPQIKRIVDSPQVELKPLIVGSTIYWLDHNTICAYDFENDVFFCDDVPNYDIAVGNRSNECSRLLHIGGDAEEGLFCIIWLERSLFHFMRVRVSKDYDAKKIRTSIISCSSKVTQRLDRITDVLLMDRFADGMKKKNVEMEFREMPNKDPLSSKDFGANFLKRCKKRSVDLENVLSRNEESLDGKVMRSKEIRNLPKKLLPSQGRSESKAIGFRMS